MDSFRACVRQLSAVAALLILSMVPAVAADSGSISGSIFDQAGEAVADAVVRLSGDSLPAGRTARTGVNGSFRFDYLVPGDYLVEVAASGVPVQKRLVRVDLGRDSQADFVTGSTVTEALTVTATTSGVDVHSSEASFNFKADELAALPLERTYRGLFQLLPGVADNRSKVGPA